MVGEVEETASADRKQDKGREETDPFPGKGKKQNDRLCIEFGKEEWIRESLSEGKDRVEWETLLMGCVIKREEEREKAAGATAGKGVFSCLPFGGKGEETAPRRRQGGERGRGSPPREKEEKTWFRRRAFRTSHLMLQNLLYQEAAEKTQINTTPINCLRGKKKKEEGRRKSRRQTEDKGGFKERYLLGQKCASPDDRCRMAGVVVRNMRKRGKARSLSREKISFVCARNRATGVSLPLQNAVRRVGKRKWQTAARLM